VCRYRPEIILSLFDICKISSTIEGRSLTSIRLLTEDKAMEITEVKVFPVDEEKLKAYITIVLDNCFVVRDLKIIGGTAGLFVAMPSKRRKDGTFKDIAHPLNQSTRATMEKIILDAYLAEIKKTGGRPGQSADQAEKASEKVDA
jgi:stage V sporulation protein G